MYTSLPSSRQPTAASSPAVVVVAAVVVAVMVMTTAVAVSDYSNGGKRIFHILFDLTTVPTKFLKYYLCLQKVLSLCAQHGQSWASGLLRPEL